MLINRYPAILALCSAVSLCQAQPRLELQEGYIRAGAYAQHVEFRVGATICNRGSATLHVREVRADCPCVTPVPFPEELAPGTCEELLFDIETREGEGLREPVITVVTDDPRHPSSRLRIGYHVGERVRVSPPQVWFGPVPPGEALTAIVAIESLLAESGTILRTQCEDRAVRAVILDKDIETGSPGRIEVRLATPETPRTISATVEVYTSLPGAERVTFSVEAIGTRSIVGPLRDLDFGRVQVQEHRVLRVPLTSDAQTRFRVLRTEPDQLSAWVEETSEKRRIDLVLRWDARGDYGPYRGRVRVATSGTESHYFAIPVRAEISPVSLRSVAREQSGTEHEQGSGM